MRQLITGGAGFIGANLCRRLVTDPRIDAVTVLDDLSTTVGCQVPNMSQHLTVLRSAGLVESRRDGSTVFYRLVDARVLDAYRLLQQVAG